MKKCEDQKCRETLSADCFRKGKKICVWCEFKDMKKRATARFRDKAKFAKPLLKITETEFVAWYINQPDRCNYCHLTFDELKRLKIKRRGGYSVSWDIDRKDSNPSLGYKRGNLALSCFVCNMAKGEMLTAPEARVIGKAVRKVWNNRLRRMSNE